MESDEGTEGGDLQKAFLAFKRKRQIELKQPVSERSEAEVAILRSKFLKQIKSYLGVPYHRRYHGPESEHHNAALYLDCCGLIRKVCYDMQIELGFILGGWNQGYQFDTLPIKYSTPAEMKPGDLVFISGTYIKPHPKKQVHDMVHVEVWLGQGERTIGARWKKGVVEVHDSYKFISKSYTDMKYYFCSIDTWLHGVCRSFCQLHTWIRAKKKKKDNKRFCKEHQWKKREGPPSNKFSIFSGSQSPDDDQQSPEDRVREIRASIKKNKNIAQQQEQQKPVKKSEKGGGEKVGGEEDDCSSSYNQSQYSYTTTDTNYSCKGSSNRSRYTPSVVDIYPFKAPLQAQQRPHTVSQMPIGYGSLGYVPSILRCGTTNINKTSHQEIVVSPVRKGLMKPVHAPQYSGLNMGALRSSPRQGGQQYSPRGRDYSPKQSLEIKIEQKYPSKSDYKKYYKSGQGQCVEILKYSVLNSQIKRNEKQSSHAKSSKKSVISGGKGANPKTLTPLCDPSTESFISLWNNVNFGKWTQAVSVVQKQPNTGYVRWQRDGDKKTKDLPVYKSQRPLFRAKVS